MQHQVQHSTIVRSAHTVFTCFVFIWEQTVICATHTMNWLYNRNGKCLQRGTDWVFKYSSLRLVFKWLTWFCLMEVSHMHTWSIRTSLPWTKRKSVSKQISTFRNFHLTERHPIKGRCFLKYSRILRQPTWFNFGFKKPNSLTFPLISNAPISWER